MMIKFSILIALLYLSSAAEKEALFKSDLDNTQDHLTLKPFKDSKDSILSTLLIGAIPVQSSENPVYLDATLDRHKPIKRRSMKSDISPDVQLELDQKGPTKKP